MYMQKISKKCKLVRIYRQHMFPYMKIIEFSMLAFLYIFECLLIFITIGLIFFQVYESIYIYINVLI